MSTLTLVPVLRRARAALLVTAIAAGCACTNEGAGPTTTGSTTTVAVTAPATSGPPDLLHDVDAVLVTDTVWDPDLMDALRDFVRAHQALAEASTKPNAPGALLSEYWVEPALSRANGVLQTQVAEGTVSGPPTTFRIRAEDVQTTDAGVTVVVCLTLRQPLRRLQGEVVDDQPFSQRLTAAMVRGTGHWLLQQQTGSSNDGESCD